MADQSTPGDKKLSVPSKTLTLKPRVETGTVRQSFPHGRTKQVVVEKRGKRRVGGDAPPEPRTPAPEPVKRRQPGTGAVGGRTAASQRPASPPQAGSGVVLRTLTEDEHVPPASARWPTPACARSKSAASAEEEAKRRAAAKAPNSAEREAAEARRKAEEERHRHEEEAKRKAETEAKKRFGEAGGRLLRRRPARLRRAALRPTATTARPGTTTAARTTTATPRRPARPGVAAEPDEDEGPRQIRRGPGGARVPSSRRSRPTSRPAEAARPPDGRSPRSMSTTCASARSPRSAAARSA